MSNKGVGRSRFELGKIALAFRRVGLLWGVLIVATSAVVTVLVHGDDPPDRAPATVPTAVRGDVTPTNTTTVPRAGAPADKPEAGVQKWLGQRLIARVRGTRASRRELDQARAGSFGGIILFADNITSVAQARSLVHTLQRAALDGGNPPLWVTVDQEGGEIRRFPTLPPKRSAAQLASGDRPVSTSRAAGRSTAVGLRGAGVNVDLAPVADIRHVDGGFLDQRSFASSAARAAPSVCAFAKGLRDRGVLPTLKHFPGLGYAQGTTDTDPVVIDRPARALRADLKPYRECADRGLVMISSAGYPRLLGSSQPAVLVRSTYRRVLADTGSPSLTISDDLEAGALAGRPDLAVRAAKAGLDLLLYSSSPEGSEGAYAALRKAAGSARLSRESLRASFDRIVAAKAALLTNRGLAKLPAR